MFKQLMFVLILLNLPVVAGAANCWSVSRIVQPSPMLAYVAPPANSSVPGFTSITCSDTTFATALSVPLCATTAQTSMHFQVAVPDGYTITSILVDDVEQTAEAGEIVIHKGVISEHTLAVTYTKQ